MAKSSNYERLYSLYLGVAYSKDSIEATNQILMTNDDVHTSYGTVSNITKSLFHMKSGVNRSLGSLTSTDVNKFIEDPERKSRDIIVARLNEYIRYLQGYRSSDYKICALYSYLIFEGLYGILADIYVPDHLRKYMDAAISELTDRSSKILIDTLNYFKDKGNEELSRIVVSLDSLLLTQPLSNIKETLEKVYQLSEEDVTYIQNQRYYYLKLTDKIDRSIIYEKFGISSSSYNRSMKVIINDLVTRLNEVDVQLLTDLFLKR